MENRFRFLENVTNGLYYEEYVDDEISDSIYYEARRMEANFETPEFHSGCTKVCFNWEDLPYVIKCSFEGKKFYVDTDDNGEEYFETEDFDYDSCEDELTMYEDFKSKGLEMFFAETWAAPNHSKFICAEKVTPICDDEWNSTSHKPSRNLTEQEVTSMREYYPPFNRDWINNCIIHYGIEKTILFLKTCQGDDWMDDMHMGNYGYNEKGEPKILDWGGAFNI